MYSDPATYVDGVPVKIAERFRPPRKVSLPPSCIYQINTEILTDEYDFVTENKTLQWLEEYKNYKDNLLKRREENINKYEEDKKKRLEELLKEKQLQEEKSIKEEEEKRIKEEEEKKLNDLNKENETNLSDNESNEEILNEKIDDENIENDIENKNIENQNDESTVHISKNECQFSVNRSHWSATNYYDQSQHVSNQQSYPNLLIPTQCTPQVSYQRSPTKGNSNINFAEFEGDASDPFDSAALKSINEMEELAKVLQNSNINSKESYVNSKLGYTQNRIYPNGMYSNIPFHSYENYPNFSYNQYPYGSEKNSTNGPLNRNVDYVTSPPSSYHYTPWKNFTQNSIKDENPPFNHYNYAIPHSLASSTINTHLTKVDNLGGPMILNKRHDLEEFYTRYYSPHKTQFSGSVEDPLMHKMRSSSSVPDLTVAEDNEVSRIVSKPLKMNLKPNSNPPSRPSSTVGVENLSKNTASPTVPNYNFKTRFPDPFGELTSDAQAIVQNMAEMGFPRSRVARAVQKLGTDHKKLLEVLLILQSYQDSGEDEYRSESAFYFFMGDLSKVKEFLAASKTLLDLGFEEEKVMELLFMHDNDKEKCLEELIS